MISEQLITDALQMISQYTEADKCTGNIQYKSGSNVVHFELNNRSMSSINTYELMNLVKQYAISIGYRLESCINFNNDGECKIHYLTNGVITRLHMTICENEPDAVFAAIQYIIRKDKK